MDDPHPTTTTRCVFCGGQVAGTEACPLLPSGHWACCACPAPAEASPDAA